MEEQRNKEQSPYLLWFNSDEHRNNFKSACAKLGHHGMREALIKFVNRVIKLANKKEKN